MNKDETTTQPTVAEATPQPARQRKAKIAAAVVGVCLLAMGSSLAASMAFGSAMGDHGPPAGGSPSMQSSCPDGPPSMGPS